MSTRELLHSILLDQLRIENLLLRLIAQKDEGANETTLCKTG